MTNLSSIILSEAKNLYSYRALARNFQTDPLPISEHTVGAFQGLETYFVRGRV
jgi:hypothetical protein